MKFVALAIFVMSTSLTAFGGNEIAHGGGAFVCRDNTGQITDVILLDLWEAELNSLAIVRTDDDIAAQVGNALTTLSQSDFNFALKVQDELFHIQKIIKDIP